MKIRNFIACSVLLSFSFFAFNTYAESSVWKISKGENYFYLGGTVHLLTAIDHPLPDEFAAAYKDASEIIFEIDQEDTATPEFQAKFMAAMTYSDGRTLESELSPDIYQQLERFMASRQIPIAHFARFQPWGASLMITLLEYQRLGMMPNYGVDAYFNNLALTDSKQITSLETPDEQLSFLASMANIDPDAGIEYTLRDLERLPEFIHLIKQSWRSGDIEAFSESASIVEMQSEFPELYNTLVTSRNNDWMAKLTPLVNDNDNEFVLVGTLHLNGKDGLLSQLKDQGFKVEQL